MPDRKTVQSAERVFQVLEALAEGGPAALTVLSQHLGLSKSTTHRMLHSLAELGYVRKEEASGKYCLTLKLLEISGRLLEQFDVLPAARRHLEKLMRLTNETVHLVQREGDSIVYIDKVESAASSIRMVSRVGMRLPLYCTGVGKAILAELPDAQVREIWEKSAVTAYTPHTITTLGRMARELAEVRKKGYAVDNEENELGVRCIAACIHDYTGQANYAFSISAPVSRMPDARVEELARFVLQVKAELSLELGYAPCRRRGAGAPFPI